MIYRALARHYERTGDRDLRRRALLRSWELLPDARANGEVRRHLDEIEGSEGR